MLWEWSYRRADAAGACRALTDAWSDAGNKVFVLRASDPIEDPLTLFDGLLPALGTVVPLGEDIMLGDRDKQLAGQVWTEVRYDPRIQDSYRHSANAQPLHTDGSYYPTFPNATLMVCVANAGEGGETIFLDAADLVEVMRAREPEMLSRLRAPLAHSRCGETRVEPVVDETDDQVLINWNYHCVDRSASPDAAPLAKAFHAFLNNNPELRKRILPVKLRPGDAVTWKDREVLHGRNGFTASQAGERFLWKCSIDIDTNLVR